MDMICLDTNILIAHKRAKTADKNKTDAARQESSSPQKR